MTPNVCASFAPLALRVVVLASLLTCPSVRAQDPPPVKEKATGPMVRMLCVNCLSESQEVILASKADDGKWTEHATVQLRSSFISPWMPAAVGNLFLTKRTGDGLTAVGEFKIAENTKRALLILLGDPVKKQYRVDVLDTEKLMFKKGMILVANYSPMQATAMLGSKRVNVLPGQRAIDQPAAGKDGMYRLVVGYQNETKQLVPCYDRYIPENPDSRDFLLLFSDANTGLKVFCLSEFGPFE